jgi:hypothetical protein
MNGKNKFAAPVTRVFEALTQDTHQWWTSNEKDLPITTLEVSAHTVLLSSPWRDRPTDQLHVELSPLPGQGTELRWALYAAPDAEPPVEVAGEYKHRINFLFGYTLRDFVDGGAA